MIRPLSIFTAAFALAGPAVAQSSDGADAMASQDRISAQAINQSVPAGGPLPEGQSPMTARLQVLLDRAGASPGVIDGWEGENVDKALRALEEMNGLPVDGRMDEEVWATLEDRTGDAFIRHTISEDDVSRIVAPLPEDYAQLAERDWLGYTSAAEKIAERFHMDMEFLKMLNPDADFTAVGTEIWVADPGEDAKPEIARLVADKSLARLLAYDGDDRLVLSYPVTIGSDELPSPSGIHEIAAVAVEAAYSYRPSENFQQGDNDEPLRLPPGPNGPVGIVWIDLSEPTYGLHGTPEPDEIDKSASHGCVRMTNWDALELAHAVEPGVPVEFRE
jgi:lipoprotein-anchoring transpeptidase ErfK/SrfK